MSAERYFAIAQNIAQVIPGVMAEQGLDPVISRFVLTESARGEVWLFVVMDDSVLKSLASYAAKNVLAHMTTALGGHQVVFSNSFGLRYAVRLSPPRPTSRSAPGR